MKFWIGSFCLLLCGVAFATPQVQFTGRLTNGGVPFDGVVNLTVKSYASMDDEVELWTEVFENVDVVDGAFREVARRLQHRFAEYVGRDSGVTFEEQSDPVLTEQLATAPDLGQAIGVEQESIARSQHSRLRCVLCVVKQCQRCAG